MAAAEPFQRIYWQGTGRLVNTGGAGGGQGRGSEIWPPTPPGWGDHTPPQGTPLPRPGSVLLLQRGAVSANESVRERERCGV